MLRRHVVVGVFAAAALLLAGCAAGESTTPVGPTSVAPTPTTTAAPAPDSTDSAPVGPRGGGQLPAGFPVPPGVIGPLFVWNRGGGVEATFGVGSPRAAYDFYRSALPAAGYTITEVHHLDGSDGVVKRIDCSGNGYNGWVLFSQGRVGHGYTDGGTVDIELSRP